MLTDSQNFDLGREFTSIAPTRIPLISKGRAWNPNHGDTACKIPFFDAFGSLSMAYRFGQCRNQIALVRVRKRLGETLGLGNQASAWSLRQREIHEIVDWLVVSNGEPDGVSADGPSNSFVPVMRPASIRIPLIPHLELVQVVPRQYSIMLHSTHDDARRDSDALREGFDIVIGVCQVWQECSLLWRYQYIPREGVRLLFVIATHAT